MEEFPIDYRAPSPSGKPRPEAAVDPAAPLATDVKELVRICAIDSLAYCKTFFPKTVRQEFAGFHRDLWYHLEDSRIRFLNVQIFRDGAKTTMFRLFASKRIAYGLSHTILFIGKSESHAVRSGRWLRGQVERNKPWASTYNLRKGNKWSDVEFEILQGTEGYFATVLCLGITGSTRGINIDDYRPDLIVLDDPLDEENTSTAEQRLKTQDLILGALMNSLSPRSESPDAKMAMLQTPMNGEDASMLASKDRAWRTVKYSCWTAETQDSAIDEQESSWAARYPSAELREQKRLAIERNKLSIWNREKEVKLSSPETNAFRPEWLQCWEALPKFMTHVVVIDPVPPPSKKAVQKGLHKQDYEAIGVVGVYAGKYYLRELVVNRGHNPSWTIAEFFRLCMLYKPQQVVVETIAYQRTLAWLLRQAMQTRGQYWAIIENDDQRAKYDKIVDGLNGTASAGALLLPPLDSYPASSPGILAFREQFNNYPDVSHDDALEVIAIAVSALQGKLALPEAVQAEEDDYKPLQIASGGMSP